MYPLLIGPTEPMFYPSSPTNPIGGNYHLAPLPPQHPSMSPIRGNYLLLPLPPQHLPMRWVLCIDLALNSKPTVGNHNHFSQSILSYFLVVFIANCQLPHCSVHIVRCFLAEASDNALFYGQGFHYQYSIQEQVKTDYSVSQRAQASRVERNIK